MGFAANQDQGTTGAMPVIRSPNRKKRTEFQQYLLLLFLAREQYLGIDAFGGEILPGQVVGVAKILFRRHLDV